MKTFVYALVFHTMAMPCAIMIATYIYWAHTMYIFLGIFIALLWMFIFGKIYVNKITKLKQEIDASEE